jgi:hypothetical protein
MNKLVLASATAILALGAGALVLDHPAVSASMRPSASMLQQASTLQQQHSFGTIPRGSTVCVGPLSPTTDPNGNTPGVQIVGFTSAQPSLTWQVFKVSSQSAPVLVFQTTASSVDQTIPPDGSFLFHACVVKNTQASQDYDLTLNSFTTE